MSLQSLQHIAQASGGIIYFMALLLLVALTIVIERSWFLYQTLRAGVSLMAQLDEHHEPALPVLKELSDRYTGCVQERLINTAIQLRREPDHDHAEARMEESIMREIPHVDRFLWILDTIVTLAPLLGLLGTIIGMFNAFSVLSDANNAPTQVTGGVAEALLATACGLFIAILGLIAFNGLNNRVRVVMHQLETIKVMLLNRVKAPRHAQGTRQRTLEPEIA
ncbi:MAG: MotA/TolQ/ExbB proton channel family protein [Pseudomonadales bacterium]|nr:MotA/TolQ/ExbB proton channel family protein [Pseudomonadales bacterium]